MFRNNLKIIWRNFIKDRQFTALNLLGLSTGLCCTLLIYLWVSDEINVDKYNQKDKQLYQVMANLKTEGGIKTITYTPGLLGKALGEAIPEIEYAVSVLPASWFDSKGVLSIGDIRMKADGQYVGKNYFNVFTNNFIEGDKKRLLEDKSAIAISDDLAIKLSAPRKISLVKRYNGSNRNLAGRI